MEAPLPFRARTGRRLASIGAIASLALLLGACSNSVDRDRILEQRIAAAEAKADEAQKRAEKAEDAASQQQLHIGNGDGTVDGSDDSASSNDNELTDSSTDDSAFDNEIVAPEPLPPAPDVGPEVMVAAAET